ncbi:MAG: hypothetical protein U7127_20790 [Phormidium sp.]
MTENEAIQKAREWALTNMSVQLGTPKKAKYHSEGGEYLTGDKELKKLPYWKLTFYVKSGSTLRVDSGPFGTLYDPNLERIQKNLADMPPVEYKFLVWTNGKVGRKL